MRAIVFTVFLSFLFSPAWAQLHKDDVAICGASSGYSYLAFRKIVTEKDSKWSKDTNDFGSITLKKYDDGRIDLLFSDATKGAHSSLEEGAKIIPTSITDEAISLLVVYPMLTETYVFQKLTNGKFQVMWTQAKAETPVPKIAAWVAECSYLDIEKITP